MLEASENLSGPSSNPGASKPCTVCQRHSSIYTCPGCSVRTCSLACSSAHKQQTRCSGIRNKAAYVPMNQYGYGALMNDYTYLEEVGRQVGDWGKEIVREKLVDPSVLNARGTGRGMAIGRGRGRGRGRGGRTHGGKATAKRETLKRQLDLWDVDVDLLPAGMAKAQLNKSSWDFKSKTALLTVEFKLHPPPPLLASQAMEPPFVLLTHHNKFNLDLLSILRRQVGKRPSSKTDVPIPAWAQMLVSPDPDDPESFVLPLCVMRAKVDSLGPLTPGQRFSKREVSYWQLDSSQKLSALLRDKHFVEFPTIEVWHEGAFRGTIVDSRGAIERVIEEERRPKRRRLDVQAGKKAIKGLLGGYGSESEQDEEGEESNVLSMLGGYAGSDNEDSPAVAGAEEEDITELLDEEDAEGEDDTDYRTMLDSLQVSKGKEGVDGIDDVVDWGDSGSEEE